MRSAYKLIAIGAIATVVAAIGGYAILASRSDESVAASALASTTAQSRPAMPKVAALQTPGALPQGHPPLPNAAQAGPVEREGKVEVDPLAKFVHFRTGNRNVKDILVDGKVLWVGTSGGVIRYDTSNDKFRLFDNQNGLLSNGIFHVGKLGGRIVVGTYGGGMGLYDEAGDKWELFNVPEGLGDAFVYDVLQTRNGDVWVATWSGANRIRGGALRDRSKWDLYTVANTNGGLPNDWVYGLAEGKNGEIWLATEGGIARFDDNKWQNWNHAKGLGAPYEKVRDNIAFKSDPAQVSSHHARQKEEMGLKDVTVAFNPNYVVSLAIDREGVVWAGTWGGGLSRFDGKSWRHFTTAEGLPGNHVFMLHLDAKGRLWIGTNNGLAWRDGDKFSTMTTKEGLFANNVFSMATGQDGSLWVGGFGGVAHIAQNNQR